MLDFMRRQHSNLKWVWVILIAVFSLSLVTLYMNPGGDVTSINVANDVASIGGDSITAREFQTAYRSYVDRMRGRLTRVSWQDQSERIQSVTIQYEPFPAERSEQGESQITTIEELCVHVYKQRKKIVSTADKSGQLPLVNLSDGSLS
jgi:hypothetical protein